MSSNLYIVPFDFSPVSEKALEYAIHLGKHVETEIKILHLSKDKNIGITKAKLLEAVKTNTKVPAGVKLTTLVEVGSIFKDIGKIAAKEKAQLVIMGTHGLRGGQWLFGSFAMKVLRSADCPFLIVQKSTKIEEIEKIVIPIDLTKESMQIVNIAGDMSNIMNAKITVLAEKQTDQILNQRIQNRIGIIKKQYEEREIETNIHFVKNTRDYRKKIMKYVNENNIGLIALSYHSESLFPQFDTFAQKLITNKPALPVLIINSKLASALYF